MKHSNSYSLLIDLSYGLKAVNTKYEYIYDYWNKRFSFYFLSVLCLFILIV